MKSLLPEPKNMKQMKSLHFIVEGKFIQDMARRLFWFEDQEKHAIEILKSFREINERQLHKILDGDAIIIGESLCDEKDCEQCIGKKQKIAYVEKPDIKFKKEKEKRVRWMDKNFVKIGEFHISKKNVEDYQEACERLMRSQRNNSAYDEIIEEEMETIENGIIHAYPFKIPSKQNLKISDRNREFIELLQDHLKSIRKQLEKEWNGRTAPIEEDDAEQIVKKAVVKLKRELATDKISASKKTKELLEKKASEKDIQKSEIVELVTGDGKKYSIPKVILEDYVNAVRFTRSQLVMGKASLDNPIFAMNAMDTRIEKHKRIFEHVNVHYHGDIGYFREKNREATPDNKDGKNRFFFNQSEEERISMDLSSAIDRWIEEHHPEVSLI